MRFIIFCILFPVFCFGQQSKTGAIHYGEVQSMGMGAPVGSDYNALLIFDKDRSLYITRQDSLEGEHKFEMKTYSNGSSSFTQTYATNEIGFRYYYDRKQKKSYSRDIGFWRVKEKTPTLSWELYEETKTIGDFICHKAIVSFRGRNYTAWYTPQIPLPYGPWKLQGLPGVILEAYDTNKEIYWYFKSVDYPGSYQYLLKNIHNPKDLWFSFEEYRDFLIKNFRESIINSRMVSQNAGIEMIDNKEMLNSFIEGFDINEK